MSLKLLTCSYSFSSCAWDNIYISENIQQQKQVPWSLNCCWNKAIASIFFFISYYFFSILVIFQHHRNPILDYFRSVTECLNSTLKYLCVCFRMCTVHNCWQTGKLVFHVFFFNSFSFPFINKRILWMVLYSSYPFIYANSNLWCLFLKSLRCVLSQIPLTGPNSIIGRAVVVHADPDDLGKGNNHNSLTSHVGFFFNFWYYIVFICFVILPRWTWAQQDHWKRWRKNCLRYVKS